MSLIERFIALGGTKPGSVVSHVREWKRKMQDRSAKVVEALHTSLYHEFGRDSIDSEKAKKAYGVLLQRLRGDTGSIVFATTNYDPSLEIGLGANGLSVNDGFERPSSWESSVLSPVGMIDWSRRHGDRVPVLHLHGAVGWYEAPDGRIVQFPSDQPFNTTLGAPAILPPDPEKDPFSNAQVAALWEELGRALREATHVLVLGHSLHDPPLVRAIEESSSRAHVAVTHHSPRADHQTQNRVDILLKEPEAVEESATLIQTASKIPADFGPNPFFDRELDDWLAS